MLKFEAMCAVLTEKKKTAFDDIRVISAVNSVAIEADDILKTPGNPDGGTKLSLDGITAEMSGGEDDESTAREAEMRIRDMKSPDMFSENELNVRRGIRRVNWVANKTLSRTRHPVNLRKLYDQITFNLEDYLEKVIGVSPEDIKKYNFRIAKEAATIGRILMNPLPSNPKGIASLVEAGPDDKPVEIDPEGTWEPTYQRVNRLWGRTLDQFFDAHFDEDLRTSIVDIIKDIISKDMYSRPVVKEARNLDDISDADDPDDPDYKETLTAKDLSKGDLSLIDDLTSDDLTVTNPDYMDKDPEGVSVKRILTDPRIKGLYDPAIVRKAIQSMTELGILKKHDDNTLTVIDKKDSNLWKRIENARTRASTDSRRKIREIEGEGEVPGEEIIPASDEEFEEFSLDTHGPQFNRVGGYKQKSRNKDNPDSENSTRVVGVDRPDWDSDEANIDPSEEEYFGAASRLGYGGSGHDDGIDSDVYGNMLASELEKQDRIDRSKNRFARSDRPQPPPIPRSAAKLPPAFNTQPKKSSGGLDFWNW